MDSPQVRITKWVHGTADDVRTGLLAFAQIRYGDVLIDVTVRRTAAGRICLSYPERRDSKGRRHSVVRPVDDAARRAIESVVFEQATLAGEVER